MQFKSWPMPRVSSQTLPSQCGLLLLPSDDAPLGDAMLHSATAALPSDEHNVLPI